MPPHRMHHTPSPTRTRGHKSLLPPQHDERDVDDWQWATSTSPWQRIVLSNNKDKAWCEKWFLTYSLIWPMLFGLWSASGIHLHAGDVGNMLVTIAIGSPFIAVPWVYQKRKPGMLFIHSYCFKFSVWMAIYAFIASYFFTEYFFDVLGMKYYFPHLSWNLDSVLVGRGIQRVPVMMYVHAWYFFMTYHSGGVCFIRLMRNLAMTKTGWLNVNIAEAGATFVAAMFFAVGEIYFTTLDAIKDQFAYADMNWALTWGGLGYACYFMASFPMVKDMDEYGFVFWKDEHYGVKGRLMMGRIWTMEKVVENALAAGMLSFLLLDGVCQFVLPGTWMVDGWVTG